MFTGLVEETGIVKTTSRRGMAVRFAISANEVAQDLAVDDSIAINGVCLTAVSVAGKMFEVEAVEETLRKTTLGQLMVGVRVNLERALRFSDRLGGHLMQGHVDGVGKVTAVQAQDGGTLLSVRLPQEKLKYVICEGSIAIDGVSLTVARLQGDVITISLIPHTLEKTILGELQVGSRVNVEVDLIGKYVESILIGSGGQHKISQRWLAQLGFDI